jgi:Zn-dependent peptidase ImmA (M78 family)
MTKDFKTEANDLREKAGLKGRKVNLEKAAKYLALEIHYERLEPGVSGILVKEKGRPVILVNNADSARRQRFTIAHEIGHFVLEEHDRMIIDSAESFAMAARDSAASTGIYFNEIQANRFAAELLMAEELVKEESGPFTEEKVVELAELYGVSQQAMTYRLATIFPWGPVASITN